MDERRIRATRQRLIFDNTLGEAHPLNQAGLSPEAQRIIRIINEYDIVVKTELK